MSKNKRRRNKQGNKAVSPVLAVLMMVAVAVAASLVAYAWIMNYLSFTTAKSGKAVQIQSVGFIGNDLMIYVQNVGQGSVQLDPAQSVYINGILKNLPPEGIYDTSLDEGETATINITDQGGLAGQRTTIRIVTSEGTFTELSLTISLEGQIQYSLIMYVVGSGSVTPGNSTHASGTVVDLEVMHAVGWSFSDWSGDASGTSNTTVTMDGPKTVTATFTQDVYTLTVTPVGNGVVDRNDSGPYNFGDWVRLTAVPDTGWTFSGWTVDLSGSNNPEEIMMDGSKTVIATFISHIEIFVDGFENGFSAWIKYSDSAIGQSSIVHHGTYAMQSSFTAGYQNCFCYKYSLSSNPVYVRVFSRWSANPGIGQNFKLFSLTDSSYAEIADIGIQNFGGTLRLLTEGVGTYTYNYNFQVNTWYCIEVKYYKDSSNGELRVYLDGNEVITQTGQNYASTFIGIKVGRYSNSMSTSFIVWHDDVVVSNSYIGPED